MDSQLMLLRKTVHHVHNLQIIIIIIIIIIIYLVSIGLYKVTSRKHLIDIHINIMNSDKRY